jgi:4-amino-4-deoxy-L-arabinose transferase-like glycosyltransferase
VQKDPEKMMDSLFPLFSDKKAGIFACFGLSAFCFFSIALTANSIGWTFDEVYYFMSSELLIEWFKAFFSSLLHGEVEFVLSRKVVDDYWLWDLVHNPHPPLYKILSAITWVLFKDLLGEFAAYRVSSAILCSTLIAGLFYVLKRRYGILSGIFGGLALLFMPRFFGHAHLAATEMPLMTFWFLSCWAFWRSLTHVSGIIFLIIFLGCALATKLTGILIFGPLFLWTLMFRQKQAWRSILLSLVFAPLIAILVNPGWWHSPGDKILSFIHASLSREETIPIGTFFFGKSYSFSPPWIYAPFMIAATIPASTLVIFFFGILSVIKQKRHRAFNILLGLNIPFILIVAMLPNSPVHDGIRQFIYLLPFFAYLCGVGFHYLTKMIISHVTANRTKKIIAAGLFLLLTLYPLSRLIRVHPYELCYYNKLVDGIRGAHALGLETTYWFDVVNQSFLEILNTKIPQNARVSVWPTGKHYFDFLQDKGKIRKDLKFIMPAVKATVNKKGTRLEFDPETPQYLILMSRLGSLNKFYWKVYHKSSPMYSSKLEGVPLISLYRWEDIKLL